MRFLTENIVKMVVAVLCIFVLVVLIVSFFNIYKTNSKIEQAKATLDNIVGIIERLKLGEESKYLVVNPNEWCILSFSRDDTKPKNVEKSCIADCLCICSNIKCGTVVCREVDINVKVSTEYLFYVVPQSFEYPYSEDYKEPKPYQDSNSEKYIVIKKPVEINISRVKKDGKEFFGVGYIKDFGDYLFDAGYEPTPDKCPG